MNVETPQASPALTDQNAFGVLLSYLDVEQDEYASDDSKAFVARFSAVRAAIAEFLDACPLAAPVRAWGLGHSVYLEFEEGDEEAELIPWLKNCRARLTGAEFRSAAILSYGSRWVSSESEDAHLVVLEPGENPAVRWSVLPGPSECWRHALAADTAVREDEEAESGWGPGLYLDVDAVEALGKSPNNQPTILRVAGAGFFRAGS